MARKINLCLECGAKYTPRSNGKGGLFCGQKCKKAYKRKLEAKRVCWDDIKREWVK